MKQSILLVLIGLLPWCLYSQTDSVSAPHLPQQGWRLSLGVGAGVTFLAENTAFDLSPVDLRPSPDQNSEELGRAELTDYPAVHLALQLDYTFKNNLQLGLLANYSKGIRNMSGKSSLIADDPNTGQSITYYYPRTNYNDFAAIPYFSYSVNYSVRSSFFAKLGLRLGRTAVKSLMGFSASTETEQVISTRSFYLSPYLALGLQKNWNRHWGHRFSIGFSPISAHWNKSVVTTYTIDGTENKDEFSVNEREIRYVENPEEHQDPDRPQEMPIRQADMKYFNVMYSVFYYF